MSAEEWRPIPGFEGYEASTFGRIRSYWTAAHRPNAAQPHVLKESGDGHRYARVYLAGGGRAYVHRLVALTFIGQSPADRPVVRHLDDDPRNNTPSNLAYGTQADNGADAVRNGRNRLANATHCKRGHEFTPRNTHLLQGGRRRECRECYWLARGGNPDTHLIRAWATAEGLPVKRSGPIAKEIRAAYATARAEGVAA